MNSSLHAQSRRIVYLAHGSDKYIKQAVYSLLTLLYWLDLGDSDGVEVIVYTDAPGRIPSHRRIRIRKLSGSEIARFKGARGYVHRIKLAALDEVKREGSGPVVFVDCDTKWMKNPVAAFDELAARPSTFFMHEHEGELSETFYPAYFVALSQRPQLQKSFDISPPWQIWNSGAIGIPAGHQDFFSEALDFTDQLVGTVDHGNWIEQLAVSVIATRDFEVKAFDDYLLHFWKDSCILEPVVEKALSGLSGDLESDARRCAEFPFEEVLAKKRSSFGGWARRRLFKMKRSLEKRRSRLRKVGKNTS